MDRAGRSGDTDSGYANAGTRERERKIDRYVTQREGDVTVTVLAYRIAEPGEGNRKPHDENQEQGRVNGERGTRARRN